MKRSLALFAIATLTVLVAGCSPSPSNGSSSGPGVEEGTQSADGAETPGPDESQESSGSGARLNVDCAQILDATVVKVLHDGGWVGTPQSPWELGEVSLEAGVLCEWQAREGDPMLYGWAKLSPTEATQVSGWLAAEGWAAADDAGLTVFTTADSEAAFILEGSEQLKYSSTLDGARAVRAP